MSLKESLRASVKSKRVRSMLEMWKINSWLWRMLSLTTKGFRFPRNFSLSREFSPAIFGQYKRIIAWRKFSKLRKAFWEIRSLLRSKRKISSSTNIWRNWSKRNKIQGPKSRTQKKSKNKRRFKRVQRLLSRPWISWTFYARSKRQDSTEIS
jgi:hypothetical protein